MPPSIVGKVGAQDTLELGTDDMTMVDAKLFKPHQYTKGSVTLAGMNGVNNTFLLANIRC